MDERPPSLQFPPTEDTMKNLKKLLTILLITALCLSLCTGLSGCGGKKDPAVDPNQGGSSDPADPNQGGSSGTPAPETYVYASQSIPLKGDFVSGLDAVACQDGKILASCWTKIGENIPEGVTPEWEDQYAIYGMKLFWVSLDGTVTPLEGYAPMQVGDNESTYMNGARLAADGKIVTLDQHNTQWYDGPDDVEMYSEEWYQKEYYNYMHYENNYFIRFLDETGAELKAVDLKPVVEEMEENGGYFNVNGFVLDDSGKVVVNGGQYVLVLDGEGKLLHKFETDNWFEGVIRLNDGRIGVIYYAETGEKLGIIDLTLMTVDTENAYPVTNAWNLSVGGGDYDFYYNNGSNLMGYKLAESKAEKVFNWINADVNPNNVNNPFVLDDGRVVVLQTDWGEDYNSERPETDVVIVSKVPASSLEKKTVLTLATMYLDWNTQRMLVKFNRSSPDYRIELLDYSEFNTEEDYTAGQTKLNAEIMAGKMPDILNLNGLNSFGKMASKGLLLDLMPLLNEDPELKGQLFDNVLNALMTDGKLYRTASGFNLNTVVGASSVVGDTPGWTMKQFEAALKSMPAGCDPFGQGMTRDSVLNWGLNLELGKLADWNTGKCAFDTPLFTDLLKLAAQFPKDYDYENIEWEEDTDRIATGRQMLMQAWLSDFESIQLYDAIFGGSATYIGFPTSEGVGSMLQFNDSGYAISAKCAHKDAAWQFIRTMLTSSYQEQSVWSFPTNKEAFDKKLQDAMTPQYMQDGNGNYILDEDGNKIEIERGSWGWGSIEVKITALSQAQADKLLEAIRLTDRVYNYDEELMNIIQSECEAFFAGQKTAEDVGKLLQSKLTIYINEQR